MKRRHKSKLTKMYRMGHSEEEPTCKTPENVWWELGGVEILVEEIYEDQTQGNG